ncbi:hypothetical protein SASPL_138207 [Salvia splendens]|uniref:Polysaccharide biosynthesis domain-containing protein n=1 Tax=Salvia splendens TaxID=180675 RepID=A0A8X8ZE60_SALSN|nr:hypothetical protein SASPL_138207 [Salvia splendens]
MEGRRGLPTACGSSSSSSSSSSPSPSSSPSSPPGTPPAENSKSSLPNSVFDVLLHYAALNASSTGRMSADEMNTVAAVLRRCTASCNLLVFGLSHKTLLWNSLNHNGRTVFVSDSAYLVSKLEEKQSSIEAYDVQFTTKNLLFSDCKLVVNDLPNHLYDIAWDVILVDRPRGYFGAALGRMSVIFTAIVRGAARRRRTCLCMNSSGGGEGLQRGIPVCGEFGGNERFVGAFRHWKI